MDYFSSDYFSANYFAANYWGVEPPSSLTGAYWPANYWSTNYWSTNYWASVGGLNNSIGTIAVTVDIVQTPSWYWSRDYWAPAYFAAGYWLRGVNAFYGTFQGVTDAAGVLSGSIDPVSATIQGSVTQVQYFDLTVNFTPTWTAIEYPGFFGDMAATLDDGVMASIGTFTAAGAFVGAISASVDAMTGDVDGTHVAPPGVAGFVSALMSETQSQFAGTVIEPGAFIATLAAQTDDMSAAFVGGISASVTSGTIAGLVDDFPAVWRGNSYLAGTVVGYLAATIDFDASFSGESSEGVTAGYLSVSSLRVLPAITGRVTIGASLAGSMTVRPH